MTFIHTKLSDKTPEEETCDLLRGNIAKKMKEINEDAKNDETAG